MEYSLKTNYPNNSLTRTKIADILRECSDSYIMPRYKALKDGEVCTKTGPNDLVTQADIDVEKNQLPIRKTKKLPIRIFWKKEDKKRRKETTQRKNDAISF